MKSWRDLTDTDIDWKYIIFDIGISSALHMHPSHYSEHAPSSKYTIYYLIYFIKERDR